MDTNIIHAYVTHLPHVYRFGAGRCCKNGCVFSMSVDEILQFREQHVKGKHYRELVELLDLCVSFESHKKRPAYVVKGKRVCQRFLAGTFRSGLRNSKLGNPSRCLYTETWASRTILRGISGVWRSFSNGFLRTCVYRRQMSDIHLFCACI